MSMLTKTLLGKFSLIACLLTALLLCQTVFAQAGKITGKVVDTETREPLADARVLLEGTDKWTLTADDGSYVIADISVGEHLVVASKSGYKPFTKKAVVSEGKAVIVNYELERLRFEGDEMVVTGTKTPLHIKDVPVRTEVITSQDIEEKNAATLYEALEGVPGVRVEEQCSYCNFSMVRVQGLESGHTLVLIDGQPVYSGLAGVYGLQQIPTSNIESIEIVKGSGSALYGSSAIGGIINIITKEPSNKPSLEFFSSFGTDSTKDYSLLATVKKDNMDALITAQENSGDEIDENGDGITDRVKSDNLGLGIRINVKELLGNDRFTFSGRSINEERRGGELATWQNPFAAGTENIDTDRYEAAIGYSKKFNKGNGINFNLAYTFHHRSATNDTFLSDYESIHGVPPPVTEMEPYLADEKLFVADFSYSHPLKKHNLLLGVQYSHNRLEESGKYVIVDDLDPNYGSTYISESEKHADETGIYFQDEFSANDRWQFVLGARYDTHSSEDNFGGSGDVAPIKIVGLSYDEEAFSPRVAAMFKATPNLTFRASVGTGFRVPYGFSEDLHLCSGSPRVYKPSGLKAEKSQSYSLGVDYLSCRFNLNVNAFRTDLQDKIGFADASEYARRQGYTYEWENLGDAYTQGIEFGTRLLLANNLVLNCYLTYTDAQYNNNRQSWVEKHPQYANDSKYIPRVPETTAGVELNFTPTGWEVMLGAYYTGKMYIDYYEEEDIEMPGSKIVHTPNFWIVNAKITKNFSNGLTLFAGAKNLFDYVQKERHPDDAAFIYAPLTGRLVYVGLKLRF